MNLIFCGTPRFAVPTFERLISEGFQIDLVVTNPDEPSGRGYELKQSPVKQVAEKAGIPVFQPAKLRTPETQEAISRYRPDAIVIVAYGKIVPPWMIELPRLGCINLHASLLPKYRGAAPIQWALIQGDLTTGVTAMKIDPGLDTGDILLQREVEVREDDTTGTLSERLSELGAELMIETLHGLDRGEIVPRSQNHAQATLAPMIKKEHGRIDWSMNAEKIARRVRGLRPWPGAYTTFRGKNLHVWVAVPDAELSASPLEPGTILAEKGRLLVACGENSRLELREVQIEGRKRLQARDFLNGVRLTPGEKFAP